MAVKHTLPRKKTRENSQSLQKIVITYACNPSDSAGAIWTIIVCVGYRWQDKTLGALTMGARCCFQSMVAKWGRLYFCAQLRTSASDCVDMIIISFMLMLLQYWFCHSFQWSGLWFKLVKVNSAFVMITAEHHLLSMKYSNFFYYICYLLPQHGSPPVLPFCLSQAVLHPTGVWGLLSCVYKPALVIRIPEKQIIDTMFPVHTWLSRTLF